MANAPLGPLAREEVTLRIGSAEQVVEVVRQERHLGGMQAYWVCGKCSALRSHLYVVDGSLGCRVCLGLSWRSKHILHPAIIRAAKIRQRLGAAPGLMGKLPPRPRHNMQAERYDRLARALAVEEATLVRLLGGIVRALKRRKGRLHGSR